MFLLGPAVVYSLTAPLPTRSAADHDSTTFSEDPPVLLWRSQSTFTVLCHHLLSLDR